MLFFFVQAKVEGLLTNEYSIELYQRVDDCRDGWMDGWMDRITTTLGRLYPAFFGDTRRESSSFLVNTMKKSET